MKTRFSLVVALATTLVACAVNPTHAKKNETDFNTLAMLGNEAATVTMTRIAGDGRIDPTLAEILGVPNKRGRSLGGGAYAPSDLETKFHGFIETNKEYKKLVSILNPDDFETPKGNASFTIDYSRTTQTEVEFLPGQFRRSFFIELAIGFTLLDGKGRVAFATQVADYDVVHCFVDQGSVCKDNATGAEFSLQSYWQALVHKSIYKAYAEVIGGLRDWNQVLNHMAARIVVRKLGEDLKLKKSAAYIRNKKLADFPYLFLTIREPAMDELFYDLETLGAKLGSTDQEGLSQFATTLFSNTLDFELRRYHRKKRSAKHAGIFIVPNHGAAWFNDALSRRVADAVNADDFETTMNNQGEFVKALESDARNYDKLCNGDDTQRASDRCLEVRVRYGVSGMIKADESLDKVESAQQIATAHGVLMDPEIEDPTQRYFPHSFKNPDQRIRSAEVSSPEYYRIKDAAQSNNDDAVYLKIASLATIAKLSKEMSDSVIRTFKDSLKR